MQSNLLLLLVGLIGAYMVSRFGVGTPPFLSGIAFIAIFLNSLGLGLLPTIEQINEY